MQKDENELAPWQLAMGLAVFALLTAFGFGYFSYYFLVLVNGLLTDAAAVTINKGAFYCLGAALIGSMLLYFGGRKLQGKAVTARQNKQASLVFFIGLGLAVILPQLIHYPSASYLQAQGYSECELQSRQWLHDKVMVYTSTPEHCIELTRAECEESPERQKCRLLPQFSTNKPLSG
ncbi:hypothetical protein SAMN06297280_0102 [Arsukibacterium tuosuense]|uniref:DUF1240 domain-containing protein n=1 Tax=Arsukibacterium tuosuense TaxID=1323745 RepID=A0A285JK82_9GAMM|nr:hypothetical protein [Arsukibacterium tuosuense]SNY60473.1 hypothetical protein SAMN06297280_0102 [Arsukibacterium tuosuense]